MDNATNLAKRLGASPRKLALIGALAVALVGVLYVQYGRRSVAEAAMHGDDQTHLGPRRAGRAAAAAAELPEDVWSSHAEAFDEQLWDAPDLAQIIKYDPFALPAAFPQPIQGTTDPVDAAGFPLATGPSKEDAWTSIVEDLQMQLEELRQRGVRVVVNRRDQYVALVGDRMVHVGDEINGFTVTAIDPDGVRVERKIHQ